MPVDPALVPYLCIGPLLLFVLIILIGMLFSGRLGKPPEGYSPEEQQALVRQGNALGLPVIVFFILGVLCTGLKWLFQTINVPSADWMVSLVSLFCCCYCGSCNLCGYQFHEEWDFNYAR